MATSRDNKSPYGDLNNVLLNGMNSPTQMVAFVMELLTMSEQHAQLNHPDWSEKRCLQHVREETEFKLLRHGLLRRTWKRKAEICTQFFLRQLCLDHYSIPSVHARKLCAHVFDTLFRRHFAHHRIQLCKRFRATDSSTNSWSVRRSPSFEFSTNSNAGL